MDICPSLECMYGLGSASGRSVEADPRKLTLTSSQKENRPETNQTDFFV